MIHLSPDNLFSGSRYPYMIIGTDHFSTTEAAVTALRTLVDEYARERGDA